MVDRRSGRSRWLHLFRPFHFHADGRIAALGQAGDPPTGLDVPIEVLTPALRLSHHGHDVRPRPQHLHRQRYHDGPDVHLVVPLEETLDGQGSVDRLLRGRGPGSADEEGEHGAA